MKSQRRPLVPVFVLTTIATILGLFFLHTPQPGFIDFLLATGGVTAAVYSFILIRTQTAKEWRDEIFAMAKGHENMFSARAFLASLEHHQYPLSDAPRVRRLVTEVVAHLQGREYEDILPQYAPFVRTYREMVNTLPCEEAG